jgi:fatty acid desaturase
MTSGQSSWISGARGALLTSDRDFFQVKPFQYWFDFLTSVVFAYTASTVYLVAPLFSWAQIVAFPLAAFWLYRLGSLVHEVAHLQHGEMRGFKVAWNLIVGVMTLSPSPFFTRHHRDHHTRRHYGTPQDPEYVSNVCQPGSWKSMLFYGGKVALFPLAVFLRFLLAPLSFLHPRLREFVLRRGSSLTMNWRYERKLNPFDRWAITSVELLCWIRATMIPLGIVLGMSSWTRLPLLYLLAVTTLALNQMRLLADHQLHSGGEQLDMDDHLRDSCNYPHRDFLTWLFFPFAIRYHALHHLFPTLPYHNLSAAHRYLSGQLPAGSVYHSLEQPSWWSVAKKVFLRASPVAAAGLMSEKRA